MNYDSALCAAAIAFIISFLHSKLRDEDHVENLSWGFLAVAVSITLSYVLSVWGK